MTTKTVAVIAGDGVGPEVCEQAVSVLEWQANKYGVALDIRHADVGGMAYDKTGNPLPPETLALCKEADAVLLGAVGGPQWEDLPYEVRPERALLGLREQLGLYANLRPAVIYGDLAEASTLKPEVVTGADIMVVRELTGGIYFGQPKGVKTDENGKRTGFNTMIYHEDEIRRIMKDAFDIARLRRKKLCSVDKANVLEVTELWRQVAEEVSVDYPDVSLSHLYVDNAVMQLIRNPLQFDVIVTTNMFGDILSDAAAMITGSIGMLPSASIGGKNGMYEPVHGSAPDIAGKDICNPLATILSVGMIFRYSWRKTEADESIQQAIIDVLGEYRTVDIMAPGKRQVGCKVMGELVLERLRKA